MTGIFLKIFTFFLAVSLKSGFYKQIILFLQTKTAVIPAKTVQNNFPACPSAAIKNLLFLSDIRFDSKKEVPSAIYS